MKTLLLSALVFSLPLLSQAASEVGKPAPDFTLKDRAVGQLYGAKTTPEMFVINAEGVLAYMGAIDDQADANQDSIPRATNFVQVALDQTKTGNPVTQPSTKSYGCPVQY